MGSSAEHGSSIRTTSGLVAMARAMHRRCCWPPGKGHARLLELVFDFVPKRGLRQSLFDEVVVVAL